MTKLSSANRLSWRWC